MELIFYDCLSWFPAKDRVLQINCIWASLCTLLSKSVDTLPPADLLQSALMHSSAICPHQTTQLVSHQPTKENLFFFKFSKKVYGTFSIRFNHYKSFVAFCSFFPCSLTVFHRVDNKKVGIDNEKALELDNRIFFFIFQPDFSTENHPK